MTDTATLQQLGRAVIELEAEALTALVPRLNEDFARACRLVLDSPGGGGGAGMGKSGETGEILTILPIIKRMGAKLIALTGNPKSSLAQQADAHLDAGVAKEACPLNLAPTSSTTAALAFGDALA